MKNLQRTVVSYKGQQLQGFCLPSKVQRLTEKYVFESLKCVGKQRFDDGLRICFLDKSLIQENKEHLRTCDCCGIAKDYTDNSLWSSTRKCKECADNNINRFIDIIRYFKSICITEQDFILRKQKTVHSIKYNKGGNNYSIEFLNELWDKN